MLRVPTFWQCEIFIQGNIRPVEFMRKRGRGRSCVDSVFSQKRELHDGGDGQALKVNRRGAVVGMYVNDFEIFEYFRENQAYEFMAHFVAKSIEPVELDDQHPEFPQCLRARIEKYAVFRALDIHL